jgi:hypothetical protein
MTNPLPYLVRMLLFLAAVACLAFYLHEELIRVFRNTPDLDAVILAVLLLGIFFIFRQVIMLWPEVRWMRALQHREENTPPPPADRVNLLAPMAAMMGERHDQLRLSPTAARALLDGIATRLDERRELARYLIGLLIFLGLLGTFWGLLQTIGAVADAINGLQVTVGDAVAMFAKLKGSIEGPLKGMSTAFGASLFGLSGSLVLGFLELQASQAQGRFHSELEEWLAGAVTLSSGSGSTDVVNASAPAYVEALLERNAEGLDGLARVVQRIEESRQAATGSNAMLVERLASLSETMRVQQNLLARFTELSIEMRSAVNRLGDRSGAEADREATSAHHRNLETQLNRLVEEEVRSRVALADELRGAFSRLSDRTSAEADRETVLAKQGEIEAQLARLAEEQARASAALADEQARSNALLAEHTARSHAQVADEMRQAVAKLTDRSSDDVAAQDAAREAERITAERYEADQVAAERFAAEQAVEREAAAQRQRDLETHMAKLADEQARVHAELIAELRNMAARVADRTAAEADRDAVLSQQRALETQVGQLSEDLQKATQRLSERPADTGTHQALLDQQHNVEKQLGRLNDEMQSISANLANRPPDGGGDIGGRDALLAQQQSLEDKINRLGDELHSAMSRLSERPSNENERDSLQVHQRNVEAFLSRLGEENARARTQLTEELNNAMGRMPDRAMVEADRESLASHQRNIESHLARLVEENARNRTTLVDELREAIGRLTERFAENDREAVAAHQRNIENHLGRLAEEATQNRSSLADELRGEIRLLARTLAISRGPG